MLLDRLRGRGYRHRSEMTVRVALRPVAARRTRRDPNLARAYPLYVSGVRSAGRRATLAAGVVALAGRRFPRVTLGAAAGWVAAVVAVDAASRRRALRHRGAPPGRLSGCPELMMDHGYVRSAMRRHGPVFSVSDGITRKMVCVAGLDRARRLLADHGDALVPIPLNNDIHVPGGFIRTMRGDVHRRYRRVLGAAFGPRVLDGLDATLDDVMCELSGALAAGARRSGGVAPPEVIEPALFAAWMEIFFGLDRHSPAVAELAAAFDVVDARHHLEGAPGELAALGRIEAIVTAPLCSGGPVVERSVIAALDRAGQDPIGDPTLLRNLMFLAHMTSLDTSGLVAWMVWFLAHHPQWVRRVRTDAAMVTGAPDVAGRVVSETLRLAQSEFVRRECVAEGVSVDGLGIPRGWAVRVCVGESHRDPTVFARPDEFDPDRFARRRFGPSQYSPFGLDGHSCVGEGLVRRAAERFVTGLCVAADLHVVADGPCELSVWRHWAPSSRFRLGCFPIR